MSKKVSKPGEFPKIKGFQNKVSKCVKNFLNNSHLVELSTNITICSSSKFNFFLQNSYLCSKVASFC